MDSSISWEGPTVQSCGNAGCQLGVVDNFVLVKGVKGGVQGFVFRKVRI